MGATASRSTWKGSLSVGIVTLPVRLHKANEEAPVRFNQLHAADGHRIRQKRFCEGCGNEVSTDEIVKGFPLGGDTYVQVTDEDLEALPVATKKVVQIDQFVDPGDIDATLFLGRSYYVQAEEAGARGYAIMHKAMLDEQMAGLGRIAFRESKERLALVRARHDTLVLDLLFWPDEVRTVSDAGYDATPAKGEVAMARQLVEALSGPFDPAAHTDTYREVLMDRINAKAAGVEPTDEVEIPKAKVEDFMAAIKASVEATKKGKGREVVPARKPTAKRARKAS